MRPLAKYSIGIGDRFGRQGKAQLRALVTARALGATVAPVWNKSHREHTLLGSRPESVRREADLATAALGWTDGAVRVTVHRLRRRYRELLRDEIAQTLADPAQADEELKALMGAFAE